MDELHAEVTEGSPEPSDPTAAELAAIALIRLQVHDEPVDLSVDLLTVPDSYGVIDLNVVEALVDLAADLVRTIAQSGSVDVDVVLDDLTREAVDQGEK